VLIVLGASILLNWLSERQMREKIAHKNLDDLPIAFASWHN